MSYDDLIVTRPYRKAGLFSRSYVEDAGIGRGLGGPLRFAELIMGAELTDELRRMGLHVIPETEHSARIEEPNRAVKLGVEVMASGLPSDERLPRGWRAIFRAP